MRNFYRGFRLPLCKAVATRAPLIFRLLSCSMSSLFLTPPAAKILQSPDILIIFCKRCRAGPFSLPTSVKSITMICFQFHATNKARAIKV